MYAINVLKNLHSNIWSVYITYNNVHNLNMVSILIDTKEALKIPLQDKVTWKENEKSSHMGLTSRIYIHWIVLPKLWVWDYLCVWLLNNCDMI